MTEQSETNDVLETRVRELLARQAPLLAALEKQWPEGACGMAWDADFVALVCDGIASIVSSIAWETVRPGDAPHEVRIVNDSYYETIFPTSFRLDAPVSSGSPVTWSQRRAMAGEIMALSQSECIALLRQRTSLPDDVARVAWIVVVYFLPSFRDVLPGVALRSDPNAPAALIATVEV